MNYPQIYKHYDLWKNQCLCSYARIENIYFGLSWYYMLRRHLIKNPMSPEDLIKLFKETGIACNITTARKTTALFRKVLKDIRIDPSRDVTSRKMGIDVHVLSEIFKATERPSYFLKKFSEKEFLNSYDYRINLAWLNNRANILLSSVLINKVYVDMIIYGDFKNVEDFYDIIKQFPCCSEISKPMKVQLFEQYKKLKVEFPTSDGVSLIDKYGLDYVFVDMIFLHEHNYPCR